MNSKYRKLFSSARVIPLSFLGAILVGTGLLMLPVSTAPGQTTDLLTAAFTSTTSLCVTGLVVVDTYLHWSLFGKIVILCLIQLGGLGIISVASLLMMMLKRRFPLRQFVMLHDSFNLESMSGLLKFLKNVFKGVFLIEGFGALIYMIAFIPRFGSLKGIWISVFTSVSAFCNAGLDVLGPDSLISWNSNALVLINTMFLIVTGGLGYVVWFDLINTIRYRRRKYLSAHSLLVLHLTVFLILAGAFLVFILEHNNPDTLGPMSAGDKILNSVFQSVTFRTAGFATIPQESMKQGTAFVGLLFMFIGGSPIGTAGGVKTVTLFFVLLSSISFIRGRKEVVVFRRRIASDMMRKASAVVLVSFSATFFFILLLLATTDLSLTDAAYEMFSATATVGLSRAVTPGLPAFGKILVIIAMYMGRISPISMTFFFSRKATEKNNLSYAKGRYYIG